MGVVLNFNFPHIQWSLERSENPREASEKNQNKTVSSLAANVLCKTRHLRGEHLWCISLFKDRTLIFNHFSDFDQSIL